MDELSPCPFCGESDVFVERIELNSCAVKCNRCGAYGPECETENEADLDEEGVNDYDPGEPAAKRAWNDRKSCGESHDQHSI